MRSRYPKHRFWIDRNMAMQEHVAGMAAREKLPPDKPDPVMIRGVPIRMEARCEGCGHQAIVVVFKRPGIEPRLRCDKCGELDPDLRILRR